MTLSARPSRLQTLHAIERERLIAIVRFDDVALVHPVVEALTAGGIRIIEVTMTIPGALDAVAALAAGGRGIVAGAGSVLDSETARPSREPTRRRKFCAPGRPAPIW